MVRLLNAGLAIDLRLFTSPFCLQAKLAFPRVDHCRGASFK